MRNSYSGICYRCGETVEAGEGHFEKVNGGGWRVQHADCAIRWRGKAAPTREEARAARHAPTGSSADAAQRPTETAP